MRGIAYFFSDVSLFDYQAFIAGPTFDVVSLEQVEL
jgi:hypothetical protein